MVGYRDVVEYSIDYGLSKNLDMIISRFQSSNKKIIELLNGKEILERIERDSGIGIRVINNNIHIHTSLNVPSIEVVKRKIDEVYSITANLDSSKFTNIEVLETESKDVTYVLKEDKSFLDYENDLLEFIRGLDARISRYKELEVVSRYFKIIYTDEEKYVVTSEGSRIYSRIPRLLIIYYLTGKAEGRFISRSGMVGLSGGLGALNYTQFEEDIMNDLKAMHSIIFESTNPPEGELNIVVGNEVAGIIAHEAVGHPSEADRILGFEGAQAGESYLNEDSIDETIGSPQVTVIDDPTFPSMYGFYLYDDEGIPSKRRFLIERGIVKEFLHNRLTGYLMSTNSNGSARSESFRDEPLVRMGVTFFEPGDYELEELIREARYGLYIKSFTEWNIDDLRINQRYVGFEAYLIDGGEISHPVKYPVIETNTYDLLSSLIGRSKEIRMYPGICGKGDPMQLVPVSFGGPHLLFERIRILRR